MRKISIRESVAALVIVSSVLGLTVLYLMRPCNCDFALELESKTVNIWPTSRSPVWRIPVSADAYMTLFPEPGQQISLIVNSHEFGIVSDGIKENRTCRRTVNAICAPVESKLLNAMPLRFEGNLAVGAITEQGNLGLEKGTIKISSRGSERPVVHETVELGIGDGISADASDYGQGIIELRADGFLKIRWEFRGKRVFFRRAPSGEQVYYVRRIETLPVPSLLATVTVCSAIAMVVGLALPIFKAVTSRSDDSRA